MSPSAPELILRLGTHAEKDYIEKFAPMLDGIIIGANLLEATPGATASLLVRLCGKKGDCAYYLDPMTYAYGEYVDPATGSLRKDLDWIKSEQIVKGQGKKKKAGKKTAKDFKRSYRSLVEYYSEPFTSAVKNSLAVSVEGLNTAGVAASVAKATLEYQLTRVRREFEEDEEFKDYADRVPDPAAVFAPYFYCEPSRADAWLSTNIRLVEEAVKVGSPIPLHAIVCADESALRNQAFLARVRNEIPKSGVNGVWLWFSGFYEDDATLPELTALKELVQALGEAGLEVFNMHGGYFSLALSKHGLKGISHGVGYGEQKDVVPVIGQGIPTVRYYLPALHKRLGVAEIERCFDALGIRTPADFYAKVCDCPVCRGIVVNDLREFQAFGETQPSASSGLRLVQTPAAAKRCRFHFLISRVRERDRIGPMSISAIQQMWDNASNSWGKQAVIANSAKHLPKWRAALV